VRLSCPRPDPTHRCGCHPSAPAAKPTGSPGPVLGSTSATPACPAAPSPRHRACAAAAATTSVKGSECIEHLEQGRLGQGHRVVLLRKILGRFLRSLTRWLLNVQEPGRELHHHRGRNPSIPQSGHNHHSHAHTTSWSPRSRRRVAAITCWPPSPWRTDRCRAAGRAAREALRGCTSMAGKATAPNAERTQRAQGLSISAWNGLQLGPATVPRIPVARHAMAVVTRSHALAVGGASDGIRVDPVTLAES